RLRATGRPGHGSVPHDDNAADRLVRVLQRIQDWRRPMIVTPEVREHFQQLHEAGVIEGEPTDDLLAEFAVDNPRIRSMQTNSISLTTLTAGVKHHVSPARAEATLDVRLVPGYDADRFIRELREVMADDSVEVERVFG